MSIRQRKEDHLAICLNQNVDSIAPSPTLTGSAWESVRLPHHGVPELNLAEVSTDVQFLDRRWPTPFLISSMTGGTDSGTELNYRLAELASTHHMPMGVGSQRIAIENGDHPSFELKKKFPKLHLWANLGLVQLNYGVTIEKIQSLIEKCHADALIFHCNPLQEAIQTGGDTNFQGLLSKLSNVCRALSIPVIIKETGCGLSPQDSIRLKECGVKAIDVAGLGGTHWGYIEGLRDPAQREQGEVFRSWGRPTPDAVRNVRDAVGPAFSVIASGGIRSGLDAAKSIALGADMVGIANPFLKAAHQGPEVLEGLFQNLVRSLRIAMFCSGSATISDLKFIYQRSHSS